MSDNSDVMMRFSHYLLPHQKETPFCPECSGRALNTTPVYELENTTAEITAQSLTDDAEEIRKGVVRLREQLSNQRQALLFTLAQLRRSQAVDDRQHIVRDSHGVAATGSVGL